MVAKVANFGVKRVSGDNICHGTVPMLQKLILTRIPRILWRVYSETQSNTSDPDIPIQFVNSQTARVLMLAHFPGHQEGFLRRHSRHSVIWKIWETRILLSGC